MRAVLDAILARMIRRGVLRVQWPDGSTTRYGDGGEPRAGLLIRDRAAIRRLLLSPALAMGEGYMAGTLQPFDGGIYELLDLIGLNAALGGYDGHPMLALRDAVRRMLRPLAQWTSAGRARRNVAHHYDLNGRLYSLFLDRDRQYSCAYFPRGDETLEEAQIAKKRHIAAKLHLDRPGLRVLDIGCGWGGLALTLAREWGAEVTGITLSGEQLAEARARAAAEGLGGQVQFELHDYRAVTGQYDRIVSVGMFEHVGVPNYATFFATLRDRLAPDGLALLHTIGRGDTPGSTNPWIAKYIFPGGYIPALSEVMGAVERSGLVTTDVEVLRLHYAQTLRHWRRRFAANRDAIASLYDERFCRMFEFYLAGSETAFRHDRHVVFQVQLAREQTAAPLTRDYMVDAERATARRRTSA